MTREDAEILESVAILALKQIVNGKLTVAHEHLQIRAECARDLLWHSRDVLRESKDA